MSKSEQRRFQEQMMRVQLNRQKNKENKEMFKLNFSLNPFFAFKKINYKVAKTI